MDVIELLDSENQANFGKKVNYPDLLLLLCHQLSKKLKPLAKGPKLHSKLPNNFPHV